MSTESSFGKHDFQKGLLWINVFHGTIHRDTNTIEGEWARVGGELLPLDWGPGHGRLTLQIGTDPLGAQVAVLSKLAETGGVGASTWTKFSTILLPFPPPFDDCDISCKFERVMRNDGGSMHDHLKQFKDNVVVFGTPRDISLSFPNTDDYSYSNFMCGVDDGKYDGDFMFDLAIDRPNLDSQPGFWSDGWYNVANGATPQLIQNKLLDLGRVNIMHPELIMYGRPSAIPLLKDCSGKLAPLLPGWMEGGANSVLLNGRPVSKFGGLHQTMQDAVDKGNRVRVTGFLATDCHGAFGDCEDSDAKVEIHPVYSIDVIQNFITEPRNFAANLTGVWAADDVGTYYVRQIGSTVWWLGLSRDRGRTFANVFQGTIQGNTITGDWVDVPLGVISNSGTLSLTFADWGDVPSGINRNKGTLIPTSGGSPGAKFFIFKFANGTGGFGARRWEKLYDVIPTFAPPNDVDLALTATVSPNAVTLGSDLTYTLTATNNGPAVATGVKLRYALPGGVTLVSVKSSQGSCDGQPVNGIGICRLGTMDSGASATITLVVRPSAAGTSSIIGDVEGSEYDPNATNNSFSVNATVNPSCPGVTVSSSPASLRYNATARRAARKTIRLSITNNSAAPQTVVSIVPLLNQPFTIVGLRPALPMLIPAGKKLQFKVQTQRAAGFPPATAIAPYFKVTLSCGTLAMAKEASQVIPFSFEGSQLNLEPGRLILQAQGSGIESIRLELFSLNGQKLLDRTSTGNMLTVLTGTSSDNSLANGMYFYVASVRGTKGELIRTEVRKLVVLK
ncbi:DUF11 domain-containing protein [Candidatus Acetothermia bacterium]|nr:DUF11 domain-containing protein [Candidatus Acetothermia bacterium]